MDLSGSLLGAKIVGYITIDSNFLRFVRAMCIPLILAGVKSVFGGYF